MACRSSVLPLVASLTRYLKVKIDTLHHTTTPQREHPMTEEKMRRALEEVVRLRLATNEGTLRVRADRMWEIATAALSTKQDAEGECGAGAAAFDALEKVVARLNAAAKKADKAQLWDPSMGKAGYAAGLKMAAEI